MGLRTASDSLGFTAQNLGLGTCVARICVRQLVLAEEEFVEAHREHVMFSRSFYMMFTNRGLETFNPQSRQGKLHMPDPKLKPQEQTFLKIQGWTWILLVKVGVPSNFWHPSNNAYNPPSS